MTSPRPEIFLPEIFLVVARARNGVIGRDGQLPWRLPADLKHFKALTIGKPVVMGRKTFESLGRPLPGRRNIVITRQPDWRADGAETAASLEAAIALAGDVPEVAVIGGAEIYALAMPVAARIELTEVEAEPEGDTRLQPPDAGAWRENARVRLPAEGEAPGYSFVTLVRR